MKRSICLLFLILAACAPVNSFSTPVPSSTPEITPSPTSTLEPTPFPQGFQINADGIVQVYENGKLVDLKAPEGNWGPVDGLNVVLEKDQQGSEVAVAQMTLDAGFVDADGDNILKVATYDKDIKEWVLVPDITIARSMEEFKAFPRYFSLYSYDDSRVLAFTATAGLKIQNLNGKTSLSFLGLFKNKIFRVPVDELEFDVMKKTGGALNNSDRINLESEHLTLKDVVSLLKVTQKMAPEALSDTMLWLNWDTIGAEATADNCSARVALPLLESYRKWCEGQIAKGAERKIPGKANIEQFLLFGEDSISIDEASTDPSMVWNQIKESSPIEGSWLRLSLSILDSLLTP